MTVEDYTTYTEVDVGADRIQIVGTNHIDHAAYRSEDTYLYKDYGVNYFTNFEHLFDAKSDFADDQTIGSIWALSDVVDDIKGLIDVSEDVIWIYFYRKTADPDDYTIRMAENDDWAGQQIQACSTNTWYYFRVKKVGTAFTCRIWSNGTDRDNNDTGAGSYITELSITLASDYNFDIIFACNTWNSNANIVMNTDIENLDLQEVTVKKYSSGPIVLLMRGLDMLIVKPFKLRCPKFVPGSVI